MTIPENMTRPLAAALASFLASYLIMWLDLRGMMDFSTPFRVAAARAAFAAMFYYAMSYYFVSV